jgi:hypothetical protein
MVLGILAALVIGLLIVYWVSRARIHSWPLLIAVAAWALAATYEWWFEYIYDPEGKFGIRVDLLFVLGTCAAISLLAGAWSIRRR